eukprot:UN24518
MGKHNPELIEQLNQTTELLETRETEIQNLENERDELMKFSESVVSELERKKQELAIAQSTDPTKIDPMTDGLPDCLQENIFSHIGVPDSSDRMPHHSRGPSKHEIGHIINPAPIAEWEVVDVSSWLATLGRMDGAIT